jgi:hypothetical protein
MKLWEPMSQNQVNQLSIKATLGKNVRFYWTKGSQIERTSIIGFLFDEELQKVKFRFTTDDDDVPEYGEFDPLTVFGYLQLTVEKSLELAEILYQEAATLTENSEKPHLFRQLKEAEYDSFGIPKKDVGDDTYYHHFVRNLSSENALQILDVGRITGYINENHNIWISVCNIANSTEKPYQAIDDMSQALIETTKAGLQQLAEIIKKVAESK